MVAFAIPVAAPLLGPGAGAALGGALVGTGALLRELMLREDLTPQFFDFRRGGELDGIVPPTIRLSDAQILQRLLEDAIKTPVNFPSPPNLPEILGPWLQNAYDFWTARAGTDWPQLNSRTFSSPGPGQGEWSIGAAEEIEFTYQWDLTYTYPLGNGDCSSGASGDPREEKYPKQNTEKFQNVDHFRVKMQDVRLERVCGATDSPSGETSPWRNMVVTQDGFDYVTENVAESGTETVTGERSPRTQVQMGRALSLKKNGVEQIFSVPRLPVPGTDAGANGKEAVAPEVPEVSTFTAAGPVTVTRSFPVGDPLPQVAPTIKPVLPTTSPQAPPVPDELTNFGVPPAVPVTNTNANDHIIDTPNGPRRIFPGGPSTTLQNIANEVGRIEAKTKQLLNGQDRAGGLLDRLPELLLLLQALADLFEQPLPAKEYELFGVCEEPKEDGSQPSTTVILPPEKWAERLITQSELIPDLLQAHLGYKTPTCSSTKPPLEGDWITTRWHSDEKMDHSGRRLRKLFRYRSKSSRNLGQLSSYWESFVWRAGPVCVRHQGAWWGDPQVWAESAEEGKRVIRHAAAEAGIDPDKTGRWAISGSRSPRYGMSGTMRIHVHKGFPWIAARDGASWPNYLAKEA